MARALLGHLPTATDRHLLAEVARLRRRVADLEAQVAELRASHVTTVDDVALHAELADLADIADMADIAIEQLTQEHQAEPV